MSSMVFHIIYSKFPTLDLFFNKIQTDKIPRNPNSKLIYIRKDLSIHKLEPESHTHTQKKDSSTHPFIYHESNFITLQII